MIAGSMPLRRGDCLWERGQFFTRDRRLNTCGGPTWRLNGGNLIASLASCPYARLSPAHRSGRKRSIWEISTNASRIRDSCA